MIDGIFALSPSVRYVAIYDGQSVRSVTKANMAGASAAESDQYEELLVNPTLLKLLSQRGNIDCGGLRHVIVRYGNFYQFVLPTVKGHVSVCIEPSADAIEIGSRIVDLVSASND